MLKTIAPFLDDLFLVIFGVVAIFAPERYVKKEGTGNERQKKIDRFQTCGAILVLVGIIKIGMALLAYV
jgi:hypothetical protein